MESSNASASTDQSLQESVSNKRSDTTDVQKYRFFPSTRFLIAILIFLALTATFMMRADMSVAIVCMVNKNMSEEALAEENSCPSSESTNDKPAVLETDKEFNWDATEVGFVLSGYFYGYMSSQIISGYLADVYGGKKVLMISIIISSILTIIIPFAARWNVWALVVNRILIGVFQGAVVPSCHTLLSNWSPTKEISALTGISYAGGQFGNFFGHPLSALLCQYGFDGGWPTLFYLFGTMGIAWCVLWIFLGSDRPSQHRTITSEEKEYILMNSKESQTKGRRKAKVPYKSIFTSVPVWALWAAHFSGDWGEYTMMVLLPSFFKEAVGIKIESLGIISSIPYIANFLMIYFSGMIADFIRSRNILSTINTRRAATILAYGGQASCLVAASYCQCGQEILIVVLITCATALSGLQYSGMVVNYLDIAPQYAGSIVGIGNSISCLAGIISPPIAKLITKNGTKEEWRMVMWLAAIIQITGTLIFCLFGSGKVQEWAKPKNDNSQDESLKESTKSKDSESQK